MGAQCRNSGFTLLEILVALTILAVGVLAVVNMFPQALRNARIALERTSAAELADRQLSQFRMAGAQYVLNPAVEIGVDYERDLGITVMSSAWVKQPVASGLETPLQRVTFVVEMPDGRKETFVTYVAEY